MEPNVFDKVHDVDLKKTMEQSYIDYAMSVISARALPDARDGVNIILMVTAPFTGHWSTWPRTGLPDIR